MPVKYIGTNEAFRRAIEEDISFAISTGRFRSKDKKNRNKYPLTAALLDLIAAPYSRKLHTWHHMQCLSALKKGVELDFIDIETEDL